MNNFSYVSKKSALNNHNKYNKFLISSWVGGLFQNKMNMTKISDIFIAKKNP